MEEGDETARDEDRQPVHIYLEAIPEAHRDRVRREVPSLDVLLGA